MEWYWIFLILAVAVMVFGFGVVLLNRRREIGEPARPEVGRAPAEATSEPEGDTLVAEREAEVADTVVEEPAVVEPVEPEPVKPASLRDRLAKARSAFSGAFGVILGRCAIDQDTWDDLEVALLRADVGLCVTDALLDDL